jgi:hypothetical protein
MVRIAQNIRIDYIVAGRCKYRENVGYIALRSVDKEKDNKY